MSEGYHIITLDASTSNGCNVQATKTVSVQGKLKTITGPSTVCVGQPATFTTDDVATNYTWYTGGLPYTKNGNSITIAAFNWGARIEAHTSDNGCWSGAALQITASYNCRSAIFSDDNKESITSSINMYPNPSNGTVTFNLPNEKDYQISILSTDGKLVWESSYVKNISTYDFNFMKPGVYFVNFTFSNETEVKKLIIK